MIVLLLRLAMPLSSAHQLVRNKENGNFFPCVPRHQRELQRGPRRARRRYNIGMLAGARTTIQSR